MELEEFLWHVLRKEAADRSPYVPIKYFKHISNHRELVKKGERLGLLAPYKSEAIGLTKDGLAMARRYCKVLSGK